MASRQPPLRAVDPDERRESKRPLTILEAAESGSRLEELIAMRRRIAKAMDDPTCSTRDLAALSRRQIEIGLQVEALQISEGEESVVAGTADETWDASAI
jgi:hypothetical protein